MESNAPKRRRRRLQFSVRILLLLTLAVSVPVAWFYSRGRKQQLAVAWVKKMRGSMAYRLARSAHIYGTVSSWTAPLLPQYGRKYEHEEAVNF